jgi:hypothetical protein
MCVATIDLLPMSPPKIPCVHLVPVWVRRTTFKLKNQLITKATKSNQMKNLQFLPPTFFLHLAILIFIKVNPFYFRFHRPSRQTTMPNPNLYPLNFWRRSRNKKKKNKTKN